MKKRGLFLMAILSLLLLLVTSHVYADSLVIDTQIQSTDTITPVYLNRTIQLLKKLGSPLS